MKDASRILLILVLLITLVSVFFRFYDLMIDPYPASISGASWVDEGQFAHNARNKILFGEWKFDESSLNPMYMSPVYNAIAFASFKLLGVSTYALRIFPVLISFISLFIASLFVFLKNKKTGIIYFILLVSNLILITTSRIATLEYLVLSLILLIIGFITHDKKVSWIFAGILCPFLFFSKMVSAFFIVSIFASLLLYYFLYKKRKTINNSIYFLSGFIVSSALWIIFWLIPNFNEWFFINILMFRNKINISISKIGGIISYELNMLNILGSIIILFFIVFLISRFIMFAKEKKMCFLDLFLIIVVVVFQFQIILTNFEMRRLIMLIPIILLMAAIFISGINNISFGIKGIRCAFKSEHLVSLVLLTYFISNAAPLMIYFGDNFLHTNESHTFFSSAKEIPEYIPDYSLVYGVACNELSLENTKIKCYYPVELHLPQFEEKTLELFMNGKINYVVGRENIFEYTPEFLHEIPPNLRDYIKNNFKVIKVLEGDDYYYGKNKGLNLYIYKRNKQNY